MNYFQTVAVFTYPTDLFVAKSFLESHDIECFVVDEMTIQVHNFYSNAIGGIKLQVAEKDLEMAHALLLENGFIDKEEETDLNENNWVYKLDKITSKIPIVKSLQFSTRITVTFLLLILIIILITIPISILSSPSTKERLTGSTWCISHISYKGKSYIPVSTEIRFRFAGECEEVIEFKENGIIELPGFQTNTIDGQWQMEEDNLQIFGSANFEHIYNGKYALDFKDQQLILTSGSTILYCYR